MRERPPPTDPVIRRIHQLLPGKGTQIPTITTARRVLKRLYFGETILNGHTAKAVLHLRDAGLVKFDLTWNGERKRTDWHVTLTKVCRQTLDRASHRR